jgi:hypothetical protein
MPECTLSPMTARVKNCPLAQANAAPRYLIWEVDESVDKPDIGCGRFVTRGDTHIPTLTRTLTCRH